MYGLVDWIPCVVIIMFDRYWKIVHPIHHRRVISSLDEVGIFLPWSNGVAVVLVNSLGFLKYKQWKMWPTIYSHPVYIGHITRVAVNFVTRGLLYVTRMTTVM